MDLQQAKDSFFKFADQVRPPGMKGENIGSNKLIRLWAELNPTERTEWITRLEDQIFITMAYVPSVYEQLKASTSESI